MAPDRITERLENDNIIEGTTDAPALEALDRAFDTRSPWMLSSLVPRETLRGTYAAHHARRSRVGENEDVITLLDEQGVEHEFSIVDVLEISDQRYAILQPLASGEEPDTAVIFRMEGDALVTIEDDAEFERVRAAFEAESDVDSAPRAENGETAGLDPNGGDAADLPSQSEDGADVPPGGRDSSQSH
jgi:uncharacterized protein YrzB (UPF0473 family)